MSLINEALKKAQHDRPEMQPAPPPGGPMPPSRQAPHVPPKKPRGFLWGFLLAVVIVGGVSSLLAAFLVLQLLDPSPSEKSNSPPVAIVESTPAKLESPRPAKPAEVPEKTPDPIPEEIPEIESAEMIEVLPVATKALTPQEPGPPTAEMAAIKTPPEPTPEVKESEPVASTPAPTVSIPPSPPVESMPNPEVINRLRELEIRGVMSGATKVLIYDSNSGKTQVYRAGDSMEDPLGLSIFSITNQSVQFKDYAGQVHTKSF